ncbi:hypothetical protein CDD82_520 [Ophiocordyceps australis]|uniref:Yeast cell wall synthesis Kre9/Knh1 C-terminal domain-containing protein n=1 Tax=Ophiocordyceps australis TaxID=1399860 RepID=A0A2C5YTV9_9HYPO|nr:hypothetical protein CDD82_520 [Ophiocordyceps australis]
MVQMLSSAALMAVSSSTMSYPPSYSGYKPPCYCPQVRAVTTMTFERTVTAPASVETVFFSQICQAPQSFGGMDPSTVTMTSFVHALHAQGDHSTTTVTVTLSPQSTVTVHAPVAPAKPVALNPSNPGAMDPAKPADIDPSKTPHTAPPRPVKLQSFQSADPPVSPLPKTHASQPAEPPMSHPAPAKPAVLQSADAHVSQPTPVQPVVLQSSKPSFSQSIQPVPSQPIPPKPVKLQPMSSFPFFRNTSFVTQTLFIKPSSSPTNQPLEKAFTSKPCASMANLTRFATVYNTVYRTVDPPPYPVPTIESRAEMREPDKADGGRS